MPDGPGVFAQGSSCPGLLRMLPVGGSLADTGLSPFSPAFSKACSPCAFRTYGSPIPRARRNARGLGSPLFDRLYWGVHVCFLFLRLLRCFSSPGSLLSKVPRLLRGGSPHSDIPGSRLICSSPGLFAAYHVFRRFLKPRHPPSALLYFLCFSAAPRTGRRPHGASAPCVIALLSNMSKILRPFRGAAASGLCGEYQSRTDDPLLAGQVLWPTEQIPRPRSSPAQS